MNMDEAKAIVLATCDQVAGDCVMRLAVALVDAYRQGLKDGQRGTT